MKNTILLALLLLLNAIPAFSQIQVKDSQFMQDEKLRPALETMLALSVDECRDYFIDYMKEEYDIKLKGNGFLSNKEVLSSEEAVISGIHDKAMDLYVTFEKMGEQSSRMKLTARNGYDLYFSDRYAAESHLKLKKMMQDFNAFATNSYYAELLEDQRKRLDKVKSSQEKAEKTIQKNEEDIKSNLKENVELKKENEELRNQVSTESKKLENIKSKIEESKKRLVED